MKDKINQILIIILCASFFNVQTYAQQTDSIINSKALRFSYRQIYVPAGLIVSGVILNGKSSNSVNNQIVNYRHDHFPNFHTKWDNYLQFSPLVLNYGFMALGMKPKTDIINQSVILLKSELVMLAAVTVLKNASHILRPDSSAYTSFPSGHTAQAFAAAALLAEEYGYRYKWVPYVSYGLASTVGVIRMANNKHYLSDVLVAAGIGILSTKVAYWTHQYNWGKSKPSKHSIKL